METSNVAYELSLGINFICLDILLGLLLYLQGKRKTGKFLFEEFKKNEEIPCILFPIKQKLLSPC